MKIVVTATIGEEQIYRAVGKIADLHGMLSGAGVQAMQLTRNDLDGTWTLEESVTVRIEPYEAAAQGGA